MVSIPDRYTSQLVQPGFDTCCVQKNYPALPQLLFTLQGNAKVTSGILSSVLLGSNQWIADQYFEG